MNTNRSIIGLLLRYGALIIVDAFALFLIYRLAGDGVWELVITIAVITVIVNIINLREDLYPLRWISPALALMGLMIIFPIIYTVYVALTNYGDGNLLTKQQVITLVSQDQYLPEGGESYNWVPFQHEDETYALWLTDDDGNVFFVTENTAIEPVADFTAEDDLPEEYNGYAPLSRGDALRASAVLQELQFGTEDSSIGILGRSTAGEFQQQFVYDEAQDAFVDSQSGVRYIADDSIGQFVNENDSDDFLRTGYRTVIGIDNFERFLTSEAIRGPLLQIFIWTIVFAVLSVITTFALGLFFALILQADVPFKKLFRTILIVPYAIPAIIAVATWKGMLNPNFGVISNMLDSIGIMAPPFFDDPGWAKFGILLINLWLGYPYFMLVCSGALAAIPSDMYEAADVDGANGWDKFKGLTLPMLLVAVGPLLIASFTYNFNNFVIIEAYNEGKPPIFGTPTPAGHTDILISYAFRLAFGGGRGADFGLASAITIIIFVMVAGVTLLQFRLTRQWEETSENV